MGENSDRNLALRVKGYCRLPRQKSGMENLRLWKTTQIEIRHGKLKAIGENLERNPAWIVKV